MTPWRWQSFWCGLAIAVAISLYAGPVAGQELGAQCDPEDPERCSQPLQAGESAPFSGQLVSTELAIDLGQKAAHCDTRIQIEAERARELARIDVLLARRLLEIEREARQREVDLLTERLEQAQAVPFYERPVFVASIAVVATVALFAVSASSLNALR